MKTFITLLTALLVLTFTQNLNAQTYVNHAATGNNDGSSWPDAYTTLHDALENYSAGDEIWVAAGTYLPGQPSTWPGDPKQTFYMHQDVKLYGGFDGTETMLSERDPATNVTILSGDLNGDDDEVDVLVNREDNVINVVYLEPVISPATVIDGFVIIGGHADGDNSVPYNQRGGGIWSYGSPTVKNCRFSNNYALTFGGGLYLREATSDQSVVEDCVFENNHCESSGGGLIVATFGAPGIVQVNNCQFIGNEALQVDGGGGGLYCSECSVTVDNCQFSQNSSVNSGGAMHYWNSTAIDREITVTNCSFENNTSNHGGVFYMASSGQGGDKITFSNCDFVGNTAITSTETIYPDGGALGFQYFDNNPTNDSIIITNCNFQENVAERLGGAIAFFSSFGTDNYFELSNSQLLGNTASNTTGGGVFFGNYGATNFKVNISEVDFENNSAVHGGALTFESGGNGNCDMLISGCEFTGNTAISAQAGDFPDGGALEFGYYNGNPTNDNIVINDCIFQENLADRAGGGIAIFKLGGTDNSFEVSNCQFSDNSAVEAGGGLLYLNYSGNTAQTGYQFNLVETDFENNVASDGGAFCLITNGGKDNDFHIASCDLIGNEARSTPNDAIPSGGAVLIQVSDASAQNNTFSLEDCLLQNNTSELISGGLLYFAPFGSDNLLEMDNCEVIGNVAETVGGGLTIIGGGVNSTSLIRNTHFSGNESPTFMGAAVGKDLDSAIPAATGQHIEFINCLFTDHSTNLDTAVVFGVEGIGTAATMTNCTFADNDGPTLGTNIFQSGGQINLRNTILQSTGSPNFIFGTNGTNGTVSSIGGNLISDDAIDAWLNNTDQSSTDPLFEAGSYQLSQNSPAVDAGVILEDTPATDLAGNDRVQGGCIDIGALESAHDAGTSCLTSGSREVLADPTTIFIYPNPVSATASISIEGVGHLGGVRHLNLRIVNALGQVVYSADFEKFDRTTVLEFDASDLPEGMYRVMISGTGQSPAPATMAVSSFVKI